MQFKKKEYLAQAMKMLHILYYYNYIVVKLSREMWFVRMQAVFLNQLPSYAILRHAFLRHLVVAKVVIDLEAPLQVLHYYHILLMLYKMTPYYLASLRRPPLGSKVRTGQNVHQQSSHLTSSSHLMHLLLMPYQRSLSQVSLHCYWCHLKHHLGKSSSMYIQTPPTPQKK